jgi:transmembrane sensor
MNRSVSDIAADWAVRLDAGPLSDADAARLDAWIGEDERHRGALYRAQAVWGDLDRVAGLADTAPAAPARRISAPVWRYAAGIAAAALVGGGAYVWTQQPDRYVSQVGEMRRLVLEDGSVLTLNTDSEATVRFTRAGRDVVLKRGEANFEVAHDTARPFVVHADKVSVRAVGTAFDVRLDRRQVDVAVTEGVVEVAGRKPGAAPVVQRVARGGALTAAKDGSELRSASAEAADRRMAWREGLLIFQGESLGAAAAEFDRYNQRKIVIEGQGLAQRPIFGVFRTTNVEAFAQAATTLGARVEVKDDAIHLVQTTVR